MSLHRRTDYWIDDFQRQLSMPVAMRIAEFCRDPEPHPQTKKMAPAPLLGLQDFIRSSPEERAKNNRLVVVLGPFKVVADTGYTYWQGLKVFVGDATVAAVLCRLNSRGQGGFLNVKLWDLYTQLYTYAGDPSGECQIHPDGVVRVICDHMSAQYHVGFVERDSHAVQTEQILQSRHELVYGDRERDMRANFESTAEQLFQKKTRVREGD